MQWMLLIDTCGEGGGVAVCHLPDGEQVPRIVAERGLPGRETQERLMTSIEDMLRESSLQMHDLDVLAVVTGPGSFTGIRIGIAAVKGLAEALGKPVVAVSRLAVLAAQAKSDGPVQAWLDAGRGDVFVGRCGQAPSGREDMMHGSDAVAGLLQNERVVVMEERLRDLYPQAQRVLPVGVHEALPLASSAAQRYDFADTALLDANYLRVPDAELARLAAATPFLR